MQPLWGLSLLSEGPKTVLVRANPSAVNAQYETLTPPLGREAGEGPLPSFLLCGVDFLLMKSVECSPSCPSSPDLPPLLPELASWSPPAFPPPMAFPVPAASVHGLRQSRSSAG